MNIDRQISVDFKVRKLFKDLPLLSVSLLLVQLLLGIISRGEFHQTASVLSLYRRIVFSRTHYFAMSQHLISTCPSRLIIIMVSLGCFKVINCRFEYLLISTRLLVLRITIITPFSHSLAKRSSSTLLLVVRISSQIRLIMSHPDNLRLVHRLHSLRVQARTLAARTARIVLAATAIISNIPLLLAVVLLRRIP